MARPTSADKRAAAKYGRLIDRAGVRYTNPVTGKPLSGAALLLKTASGESGFDDDATSGAGAHGRLQFMPGTRDAVLKATGGKVDPYGSIDEAYHAAALHLTGKLGHRKGLEGYNPGGGQEYVNYILGQKVGSVGGSSSKPSSGSAPSSDGGGSTTVNLPSAVIPAAADNGSALALIQAMSQQSQQQAAPSSMGVAAPSFAAGPAGGQTLSVQGGGGPGPKGADVDALLSAVAQTQQADTAQAPAGQTVTVKGAEPAEAPEAASTGSSGGSGIPFNTTKGGYRGAQTVASSIAAIGKELGLESTSEKRDNQNPYSGKGSDHDVGNKDAYAYDLSNGTKPTPEMDRAAYRIMRALGFKDYKMGQPIDTSRGVVTKGKYRFQVIYRGSGPAFGGNHTNHVHVGVKRVR